MLFEEIAEKLSENYKPLGKFTAKNCQIYGVERLLFDGDAGPFKPDILYFTQNLSLEHRNLLPPNLLCGGSLPESAGGLLQNHMEVSPEELDAAASSVGDYLRTGYHMQDLYAQTLQTLLYGKGISGVLNRMSQELQTSIVVIDMSGKVLAHSSPFLLENELWQKSVSQGFCPPAFIEHTKDVRHKFGEAGSGPFLRECGDERLYYLISRIYTGGSLFGYVFMIQELEDFAPLCYQLLPLIGRTWTGAVLGGQDGGSVRARMYTNLITDLLDGIPGDQARSRVRAGEMVFPPIMRVIVTKPLYYHGGKYIQETLLEKLSLLFSGDRTVYYNDSAVIIASAGGDGELPEERLRSLSELCDQEHLAAGISNPFSEIHSAGQYYNQAVRTIDLSGRMDMAGGVLYYKNCAFFDLIDSLPKSAKITRYCHPALARLRGHDEKKGTQLYLTLKTYALSGFNQNQTAAELYLHRNTLSYRRQKITELTGVNLDDVETQFLLRYSFMIDEFAEKNRL